MESGAQILNCSFGIPGSNFTLPTYKAWTDYAFLHDHHLVTASPNTDPSVPEWPSHLLSTHSVTCADLKPTEWRFLNHQPIAFEAKGVDVQVPHPEGGQTKVTGSSFAAAHLSGILARLLGRDPKLTPSLARELLRKLSIS